MNSRPIILVLPLLLALACGDDDSAANGDAGRRDADAPTLDASPPRVDGSVDGGPVGDTSTRDAESGDAGAPDGGGPRPIGPRPVTPTPLAEGTLFVAPGGTGTACTQASPCSLQEATARATPGDVVFLRGGTYMIDRNVIFEGRGTDAPPPVFESYPGETAVLDGSSFAPGEWVHVRALGDPVVIRRLEIRNMPQEGIGVLSSGHLLEGLHVHHNRMSGIHVHQSYETPLSNDNLITDCIVHDNSGAGLGGDYANGGNSDGISVSSGLRNRVENCLVYANSDDGIDTWRGQESYVGYSIVHSHGVADGDGNGIKAGGFSPSRDTLVEHCLSYSNRSNGIDYNTGADVVFLHNTSWDNGRGFVLGDDTTARRNIAADGRSGGGSQDDNSWQRDGEVMFVSTDPEAEGFLVPTPGGGFEDIGAQAGRE